MELNELTLKYLSACTNEKLLEIKKPHNHEILKKLQTEKDIRNYFFKEHNKTALENKNLFHLALPYEIVEILDDENKIKTKLAINHKKENLLKSQLEKIFSREQFSNAEIGDIITTHILPIEIISKEEFKKYKNQFPL